MEATFSLWTAHGWIMALAWGVIGPLAIGVAILRKLFYLKASLEFGLDFLTSFFPQSAVSARVFLAAGQVPRLLESLRGVQKQLEQRRAGNPGDQAGPGELGNSTDESDPTGSDDPTGPDDIRDSDGPIV